MVKHRDGFHDVFFQLPDVLWAKVLEESARRGESATKVLTRIVRRHYRVDAGELPPPRTPGRRPKPRP